MKQCILLLYCLAIILFAGCSESDNVSPVKNYSTGNLLFKIDRNNAPDNVVFIKAYLSNSDETFSQSINIQIDSSAELNFKDIPVGEYNLKVDAADSSNKILYSGQSDLTIFSGQTIEVTITLLPVDNGTGNIHIIIDWGQYDNTWIDYIHNPVFNYSKSPTYPDFGVTPTALLFENGTFKMWYVNVYNGAKANIGYVESPDGVHWSSSVDDAVFKAGLPGSWDDYAVAPCAIIKVDNLYRMYYSGYRNPDSTWDIGLAVSPDGINWERQREPVLEGTENEPHPGVKTVIQVGDKYYMYYNYVVPETNYTVICVAISDDCLEWVRYKNNPIMEMQAPWEKQGVFYPSVIKDGDIYKMVYQSYADRKFGIAYSSDGLHWERNSDNPFFSNEACSVNNTEIISYPNLLSWQGEYRIYYSNIVNGMREISFISSKKL